MDDRQALLSAVIATPDDDLPRLVFADWLDDNNEREHAAFIRRQIALARVPEWDPIRIQADHRVPETDGVFEPPLPDLPAPVQWRSFGETFRRGFPSAVSVWKGAMFADRLPEVFALAPVDSIEWWMSGPNDRTLPHFASLVDHPGFRRIRSLKLPLVTLTDDNVRRLSDSSHAAGLLDLDLQNELTSPQVVTLLPRIAQLESIALSLADGADDDLLAAAAAFTGRRLRRVRFLHKHLRRSSLLWGAGFINAPLFRGLTELDLSENPLGPGDAGTLARSGVFAGLESLTLKQCRGGDALAEAVAGNAGQPRLGRLVLDENGIGPAGAEALAASPFLANLRILKLLDNPIGDEGLVALTRSPYLGHLLVLDLVFCGIGDVGAAALLASPLADTLISLRLPLVGHGGVRKDNLSPAMEARLRERFAGRLS